MKGEVRMDNANGYRGNADAGQGGNNGIINPKQIAAVVRTKTFALSNEFCVSECRGYSSPLEFYSDFSRLTAVVINERKQAATGNIRAREIPDLIRRSDFICMKEMEHSLSAGTEGQGEFPGVDMNSPAFTVTLASGADMRGKTPVQFLLENPSVNRDRLAAQYAWLKENLDANPNYRNSNMRQMDAINRAVALLDKGLLSPAMSRDAQVKPFTIFSTGMRPLIRRKGGDGMCFVYEVDIVWNLGAKNPLDFTITNYYAPVVRNEKGLLNVQAKQRRDVIRNSMRMSAAEWSYVVDMILVNKRTFEDAWSRHLYGTAARAENEARERAGIGRNHG